MSIFISNVKRILRNKVQLFFIILFPLAFMSLGFIGQQPTVKTAVIDKDQTQLTAGLMRSLETKASLHSIDEVDIQKKLMSLRVDYVLVIEKGFTQSLIAGENGGITGYSVEESNFSKPVSSFVEQWISHAKAIAGAVNHQEAAFYTEFTGYDQNGSVQMDNRLVMNPDTATTRSVVGFLLISMLYTSLIVGLHILVNKNNHTLYRTLAAPISIRNYMLQTISSFLFVSLIQISFVMIMLKWVYRLDMGGSGLNIYLMLIVFSLVSVSFGVAISSVSKNIIQACLIGISLVAPLAMLGGAYFPLEFAPDIIKSLSNFTPVSWMMGSTEKLLQGETIASLGKEMSMLVLFAIIFFLVGTLRKADIAK